MSWPFKKPSKWLEYMKTTFGATGSKSKAAPPQPAERIENVVAPAPLVHAMPESSQNLECDDDPDGCHQDNYPVYNVAKAQDIILKILTSNVLSNCKSRFLLGEGNF